MVVAVAAGWLSSRMPMADARAASQRRLCRGARPGAVLAIVIALVLSAGAPRALAATPPGTWTISYSGTWEAKFVDDLQNPAKWQESMTLAFAMSRTVTVDAHGDVTGAPSVVTITGTVTSTYAKPTNQTDCTGTYSLRPGAPDPILVGPEGVHAIMPVIGRYVQSSAPPGTDCTVLPNSGVGISGDPGPSFNTVFGNAEAVDCVWTADPHDCHVPFDVGPVTGADGTKTASLHAAFDVTAACGTASAARERTAKKKKPVVCTVPKKAKHLFPDCKGRKKAKGQPASNPYTCDEWEWLASHEIAEKKQQIKELENEMGSALMNLPAHALLPENAGGLGAIWEGTNFAVKISKLRDEKDELYRELAKDPPDSATTRIDTPRTLPAPASLPCPSLRAAGGSSSEEAMCATDRRLFAASVRATQRTTSVLLALITAANRHGTALRAKQAAATALQEGVTSALTFELGDSLTAENAADLRLAQTLRAQGSLPVLTRADLESVRSALAQTKSFPAPADRDIDSALTPAGLAQSLAATLAETPGDPPDLVTTLAAPLDVSALTLPDPANTPAGGRAIVRALVAQHTVAASTGAALVRALDRNALTTFRSIAKRVPGRTGVFLAALQRDLAAR